MPHEILYGLVGYFPGPLVGPDESHIGIHLHDYVHRGVKNRLLLCLTIAQLFFPLPAIRYVLEIFNDPDKPTPPDP